MHRNRRLTQWFLPVRRIALAGAVWTLLFVGAPAWQSWADEKARQMGALASVLTLAAHSIDLYVDFIDAGLADLGADLPLAGQPVDPNDARALMQRFAARHPELATVDLLGPDGEVLVRTAPPASRKQASPSPPAAAWRLSSVSLQHPVRDAAGKVRYLLRVGLPVGSIAHRWQELPMEAGTSLSVVNDETAAGESSAASAGDPAVASPHPDRLSAVRHLTRPPLTLVASMPISVLHAVWWDRMRISFALACALLAGGLAPYAVIAWRGRGRERRRAADGVTEREARYARVLDGSDLGYWDWDLKRSRIEISQGFLAMLGYAREEWAMTVENWRKHVHPEDIDLVMASLEEHLKGRSAFYEAEYRMRTKAGEMVWILAHGRVASRDAAGNPAVISGTYADVSERKRLEANLREMATTDFLTGVCNRWYFTARLNDELTRVRRDRTRTTALLMLDLDHFKQINDTFGHAAGDAVLRLTGSLLRDELRVIDTVGRLGGEEFAILLPGANPHDAEIFAERLRRKIELIPAVLNGLMIHVTVSIGIAELRSQDPDAEVALDRADHALYRAKGNGRNRVAVANERLS